MPDQVGHDGGWVGGGNDRAGGDGGFRFFLGFFRLRALSLNVKTQEAFISL